MKPEGTRVWRKNGREGFKGVPQGRRFTHRAETNPPRRGSTWTDRNFPQMTRSEIETYFAAELQAAVQ